MLLFVLLIFTHGLVFVGSQSHVMNGAMPAETCTRCCRAGTNGIPGIPGTSGTPGTPGNSGRRGQDGSKGEPGVFGRKGAKGNRGQSGPVGNDGPTGPPGVRGPRGSVTIIRQGEQRDSIHHWKQCVWTEENDRNNGLIKVCYFTKRYDNTALRLFFAGSIGIRNCNHCCSRWYFTFNNTECKDPSSIDASLYMLRGINSQDVNRHRHIEGLCENLPSGRTDVGLWVKLCEGEFNIADASTGRNSVSRIVVEEIEASDED